MPTSPAPEAGERGFSLLEVVLSFAVLALAIGALMPLLVGAMRAGELADRRARAVVLAENALALLESAPGAEPPAAPAGFVVTARRRATGEARAGLVPVEIAVEVTHDGRALVTLRTLRLVPQEALR